MRRGKHTNQTNSLRRKITVSSGQANAGVLAGAQALGGLTTPPPPPQSGAPKEEGRSVCARARLSVGECFCVRGCVRVSVCVSRVCEFTPPRSGERRAAYGGVNLPPPQLCLLQRLVDSSGPNQLSPCAGSSPHSTSANLHGGIMKG